jgi:transitional endoplasmic reticulum ATPase
MSFLFDKKTEHETLCEAAIKGGRTAEAVFHAAKAADFAFALARQTAGQVAERYITNAENWLEIAERLRKIPNAESQAPGGDDEFQITEKPNVTFDQIAGMEQAKTSIFDMVVYPMREPEKARKLKLKPGGGVLLYGPPGNGKTMLGKAIAHEINAPFFYASGAQIRSKWHGESEQRLSRLIRAAQNRPVAVLFLDEVDGLLPRRGSGSSVVDNRIVTQFLADIGGFRESGNTLLLLGATNKPWEIDEAVFRTGRFDEKIYIGMPDEPARLGMLKMHLGGLPLEDGLDFAKWADRLTGYTGSDIVGIVHDAKRTALHRSILEGKDPIILSDDLEQALRTIPSSVTEKMLKQYEAFKAQRYG